MMTVTEPKVVDTARYGIMAASKALGVHYTTLERWERCNIIRCEYRKADHRKVFCGHEIKRVWRAKL